ncbi:FkbM family methyltransferase [Patescibacteria group bacterium]|nr:FkbM family methyltransferase [Patescibacteria group bacterium]
MNIPDSNKSLQRRVTKLATNSGVLRNGGTIRFFDFLRKNERVYRWFLRKHQRFLERHEIKNFKNVIKPGMTVLDIGANSGTFTYFVSTMVGDEGKVYAFEPEPANYKALDRLVKSKNLQNVKTYNVALSSKQGTETLFVDKLSPGSHSFAEDNLISATKNGIEVQTTTLDSVLAANGRVDIIKIDVQGAEGMVFEGGQKLLQQEGPISIFLEFWPGGMKKLGTDPIRFLQSFTDNGFNISILDKGSDGKVRVTIKDIEKLISSWSDNTDYTNILLEKH